MADGEAQSFGKFLIAQTRARAGRMKATEFPMLQDNLAETAVHALLSLVPVAVA